MKTYKEIRTIIATWIAKEQAENPDKTREDIIDVIHQAWLMETLCYCAKLSEEDAAALVDRYTRVCDELGCPLMMTEAAGAFLSLLDNPDIYSVEALATMPLGRLKILLADEASKSFNYGLEGDSTISSAFGLNS